LKRKETWENSFVQTFSASKFYRLDLPCTVSHFSSLIEVRNNKTLLLQVHVLTYNRRGYQKITQPLI